MAHFGTQYVSIVADHVQILYFLCFALYFFYITSQFSLFISPNSLIFMADHSKTIQDRTQDPADQTQTQTLLIPHWGNCVFTAAQTRVSKTNGIRDILEK